MKYKLTGTIKINEQVELLDPIMEMKRINYDLTTNSFDLDVTFNESGGIYKFGFNYSYINTTPGQLTMQMVIQMIMESTLPDQQIVKEFILNGVKI